MHFGELLVALDFPRWELVPGGADGVIQAIDRIGNLVSNVPATVLADRGPWTASIGGRTLTGRRTYGDVPAGEALALVGSQGFVEIAVHRGDARKALDAGIRDRVEIRWG